VAKQKNKKILKKHKKSKKIIQKINEKNLQLVAF
jgi:hypothetical protein